MTEGRADSKFGKHLHIYHSCIFFGQKFCNVSCCIKVKGKTWKGCKIWVVLCQIESIESETRPSKMEVYHRYIRKLNGYKWPHWMIWTKGLKRTSIESEIKHGEMKFSLQYESNWNWYPLLETKHGIIPFFNLIIWFDANIFTTKLIYP